MATLLPGAGGTRWAGTYTGLVHYAPATAQLTVYGPAEGLRERSSKLCRATWGGGC